MNEIKDVSLPDGYEAVKEIYRTDNTLVMLVRHRHLGELRILKRVVRSNIAGYEAEILKGLRHPAIPILYDYQEDAKGVCLIEEYVRGVSVKDYLIEHEAVSWNFICQCMVQLCDVISYLHGLQPYPILYLDLKPEHMILRGEELMLVDYGAALYQPRSGSTFQKFGTLHYMAPEAKDGTASVKSDLYSIGKVANEMLSHTPDRIPGRIRRMVRACLSVDPKRRPESAFLLRQVFEESAFSGKDDTARGEQHLLSTVAVTGNESGIGTSHIAIALTAGFCAMGIPAYYRNLSGKPAAHYLLRNEPAAKEEGGIIYHKAFRGIADYGDVITGGTKQQGLCVTDCGCDMTKALNCDRHIHIVGTRMWQNRQLDEEAVSEADLILLNPDNRIFGRSLAIFCHTPVMGFPVDADPLYLSKRKRRVIQHMLKEWR
ncbi:MAG: protein kinase [Lachnospiraceae bacterium]|nr:protein kinase [Lachnospiraceae bacterium]